MKFVLPRNPPEKAANRLHRLFSFQINNYSSNHYRYFIIKKRNHQKKNILSEINSEYSQKSFLELKPLPLSLK